MRMVDIIAKKRDGATLSTDEINFFIEGYTNGTIPDYQISALAMAIYFQSMTDKEAADLTMAMANSGETIDLAAIKGVKVDKHSTGGVGDTTTLVLAPLVASVGVCVAKMSGRGLGHTGGTIDKLESIKGFHTEISKEKFIDLVNKNKIAIMGQSANLTPADKKLYALRDVTATVESIPLIASSIMSKKIAAGADAIVLDVKIGNGAFMKNKEDAEKLAHLMVKIGNHIGKKTIAVISDMSQPLGFAIGNALEVKEAIETLNGNGPKDLTQLVLTLGSYMLIAAGKANSKEEAKQLLTTAIENGKALEKFKQFIANQGGDISIVNNLDKLPQAKYKIELPSKFTGYVSEMIAEKIGKVAMLLGAGRAVKDDKIDLSVGIVLHKKIGDKIVKGESLLTIYSNNKNVNVEEIKKKLYDSIFIGDKILKPTLIHAIITE